MHDMMSWLYHKSDIGIEFTICENPHALKISPGECVPMMLSRWREMGTGPII
jgi:hypothetical protein